MFKEFTNTGISSLKDGVTGVYYCGKLTSEGKLRVYYVGKSSSDEGVKGRLLDHLENKDWRDVTHFDVTECSSDREAVKLEEKEIEHYQPKYNEVGK